MTPTHSFDPQQVEVLGRTWLTSTLIHDGIEVARPERDRGIDLVVYEDNGPEFTAIPIQMKANSRRAFSIDAKYERIPRLRIVFLWNVIDPVKTEAYLFTYGEALDLAQQFGWTATESWKQGRYATTNPTEHVLTALSIHRVRSGGWRQRLFDPPVLTPPTLELKAPRGKRPPNF
jgi:hypothetical protein